ncbi:MCM2/3/5 family-domain-containing protein [Fimicolochytrium jonesii]|uniref:MCM2/3/5 family-domain-containing protein n=1 Tax=Fimicolochytrium jonesii TaxID=1396493 RepID=UPI0022FE4932|nr:MCM2/3/5 family-domain-containing protein [Fimicolochytrium jonesii]KAI8821797.1 MCM2/3/5 family-domain-containing protein [Fimicolochytrium jonesii]
MAAEAGNLRNLGADELFNERVRFFQEFLDEDYGENQYKEKIRKMLIAKERRLMVSINHLRQYNREYAQGLLQAPMDYLPPFDKALKDIALSLQNPAAVTGNGRMEEQNFYVGLEGSFGDHQVSPRNVSSGHLGKMISIEGIITRCSLVRPKVVRSVHYCEKTEVFHMREYRDGTSLGNAVPTGAIYPKEDDEGNKLTTEFGFSAYRDYQTVSLQEMPERAPAGQLPRPIDVILDDDLADKVKPGDRVQIVGVFRSLGKSAANVSAIFKTVILANSIRLLSKEVQQPQVTDTDISDIKKIARRENVFELLAQSLAPSIYGHDYIKKALLLLLLGGIEKNLANGTHLRGDINMLLIGDPSTAKSQMLRFVLNIAPLAIATTGRGSSGVGLTAAVTTDKETGERTLEAGAMVLADRGVVCIDEFDKMNDVDRVAIHEVMEQQTVTIAKAGIHTSLNARCSVLAAANPVYGHYMIDKPPHQNILLPDSLLSRFDLVFVVLDTTDDELNRMISEHVGRVHRYVPPGLEEGAPINDSMMQGLPGAFSSSANEEETQRTEVFQKYNKLLHVGLRDKAGTRTRSGRRKEAKIELLSISFLKKFLHYAKTRVKPVLTEDATEYICQEYSELRASKEGEGDKYRTMPITARTLETLIRLSTAHAKARLSPRVEKNDAEVAVEILKFALYKEVKVKKRTKRAKIADDSESEDSDDDSDGEYTGRSKPTTPRRTTRAEQNAVDQTANALSQMNVDMDHAEPNGTASSGSTGDLTGLIESSGSATLNNTTQGASSSNTPLDPQRFDQFRQGLFSVREVLERSGSDGTAMVHDILSHINNSIPEQERFALEEVKMALRQMSAQNTLWYQEQEETVIFI